MTEAQKILDKVRKLLRLSRGTPYPAEAETAMAAAQKLLLEHGLAMSQVNQADVDSEFVQEEAFSGKRRPPEARFVWSLVEEFFFCKSIEGDYKDGRQVVILVGRPEHVAVGKFVGSYLSRTFRALWSAYKADRGVENRERRGYYLGLNLGISKRLLDERKAAAAANPQLGAMIRTNFIAIQNEVDRRFPKMKPGRMKPLEHATDAIRHGFERGQKIGIPKTIPDPMTQKRLA